MNIIAINLNIINKIDTDEDIVLPFGFSFDMLDSLDLI